LSYPRHTVDEPCPRQGSLFTAFWPHQLPATSQQKAATSLFTVSALFVYE